jgi:hypothetical protein
MFDTANQAVIFLPLLVIVALTFAAFVRMAVARSGIVKQMNPTFYRAHQGGAEPESAVVAVRHYGNLLELPTLFYAAGLTAFVLGAVTGWVLVWAWAFVAARLIQSAIHLTYNNPAHRGGAFVLSMVFMIALWVTVAMHIFARV